MNLITNNKYSTGSIQNHLVKSQVWARVWVIKHFELTLRSVIPAFYLPQLLKT